MKRYFYEEGTVHCGETEVQHTTETIDEAGELSASVDQNEMIELLAVGYCVFDRLRGSLDERAIAVCNDRDDAQKIVDALNAALST